MKKLNVLMLMGLLVSGSGWSSKVEIVCNDEPSFPDNEGENNKMEPKLTLTYSYDGAKVLKTNGDGAPIGKFSLRYDNDKQVKEWNVYSKEYERKNEVVYESEGFDSYLAEKISDVDGKFVIKAFDAVHFRRKDGNPLLQIKIRTGSRVEVVDVTSIKSVLLCTTTVTD